MSQKTFSAQQWLYRDAESNVDSGSSHAGLAGTKLLRDRGSCFPQFTFKRPTAPQTQVSERFSPFHCFVPGWKGDSLPSKNVLTFERLLTRVQSDVKNELFKTRDFPRSIKLGLYNEFLSFAESQGLHFEGLDDLTSFWQMLEPAKLAKQPKLATFIDIYANRVAAITFFKLRFISSLLDTCRLDLTDRALLYPTSFLSQIFKKGSATELNSRALESNLYSWYVPKEGMKESMRELLLLSRELDITEIIKNISFRTQVSEDQQKVYSHSLSHVGLGLFLNSLQVNFPLWLDTVEGKTTSPRGSEQEQIISCKFFGDYLESLSLSHWLAQENNKDFRWNEMLCPDFKGLEFISGTFAKICNELQFLTFLAHKSENQGGKPIEYICRIMGGHFRNRKGDQSRQGLFLEDHNPFYSSTYDRVVLNLCHFPKNNPQHYLISQILDQVKYVKQNGYIFVLSSKKLFVPSLRDRLDPVLRELKVEAIFDLENVKGKGELGSYIYIFRKKGAVEADKQLATYFRISAELQSFQQFTSITDHLRSFYLSHLDELPPLAQLEFPDSFRIEFFQEAVVNGQLIHSTNEDSSRITHPAFFKGLMDSCVTLDSLFEIKALTREMDKHNDHGLNLGLKKDISYFLVVDFRSSAVNLELHPMDTFRSIFSDYGQTQCSYFQLLPKSQGLNPNILRNYFQTPVGKQVTNLTFSGGPSLVKGSLSKLLVPKFLTQTEPLPAHLGQAFGAIELTEEQLLETNPQHVLKAFTHLEQATRDLFPRYACEILSRFSNLEHTLQTLSWKLDDQRYGQKVSFQNPLVQAQLVQKKTRPLYPENDDVYLEFVSSAQDIHLPLSGTRMQVSHEGELRLHSLELLSGDRAVVRLHTEEPMALFIAFILSQGNGVPIARILRAVHVPQMEDLKSVIADTQSFKQNYIQLLERVQRSIMEVFRLHVTKRS